MTAQRAIHEDQPRPGYYKLRYNRDAPWEPVAIWHSKERDGLLVARVGAKMVDPHKIWTWCADNPIDKETAKQVFDTLKATGRVQWPDQPDLSPIGNIPSDPFEAIKTIVEVRLEQAEQWLKNHPEIKTQAEADFARNMQAELQKRNAQADEMFEVEKRPHLEAGRAVDAKFSFRKTVEAMNKRLSSAFGAFMRSKEAELKEKAAKEHAAKLAAAEAERKRIEAERARLAKDDPIAFHTSPEPELPELPLGPAPVKVQAGGGIGDKAGLRDNWKAKIESWEAVATYFAANPDVQAVLQKLANSIAKASKGTARIPGAEFVNERIPA